jgi:phage shock protein PspC (stress-responsive transcriptional regulator)
MKKLYRSNQNVLGGVCEGLGKYFEIDGTIIRVLFALLIFTPFPIFITYLILWMVIPSEPKEL